MAPSRKSRFNANQQANWTNRGISLLVLDEKYGVDACELKEEKRSLRRVKLQPHRPLQQSGS